MHAGVVVVCFACLLLFRIVDSPNVINTIYVMASYTYGPLLGLFAFGLYTRWEIRDHFVPIVVIAAPIVTALLDHYAPSGGDIPSVMNCSCSTEDSRH